MARTVISHSAFFLVNLTWENVGRESCYIVHGRYLNVEIIHFKYNALVNVVDVEYVFI
jgi:hypothetical protein